MEDKPKTYLDRENKKKDTKYFFVSYSHKDAGTVYEKLSLLYDSGVNYWYDAEMRTGDLWDTEVKVVIENNNCIGCIFFFSINSLSSDAVYKEIKVVLNKMNTTKSFVVIPVLINLKDYDDCSQVLWNYVNKKEGSNSFKTWNVMSKDFDQLMEVENNEAKRLYIDVYNQKIIDEITSKANDVGATCNSGATNFLKLKEVDRVNEDIVLTWGISRVQSERDEPIKWILFKKEGNKAFFVSKYCYQVASFHELKDIIKMDNLIDINEEESAFLFDIKNYIRIDFISDDIILNNPNIGEAIISDLADSKREQKFRAFWVKNNQNNTFELYNSNNIKIDGLDETSSKYYKITAGVRLILEIEDDLIEV